MKPILLLALLWPWFRASDIETAGAQTARTTEHDEQFMEVQSEAVEVITFDQW